jgi:O-antigen/teichoic acid export membrane protein
MFVKSKNDLLIYACITVFSTVGNNIFNTIFFFKKHISIKQFLSYKDLNLIRHLKPSLQLFALNLIISIYINLDTIMLGFMKGNQVVGYYSSAVKFYRVLFSIVTSLGVVMLPRFSNIVQNNDSLEFKRLINKSLSFTLMISLPLCLGLIILSKSIIILFGGQSYEPSIITLQILSPIIVLAGITNVIGIQIFYPNNKQNLLIISVLMGAIVNIILNYNLIPKFSHNGAAFSTLIAELIVFLFQLFFLIKYMSFNIFKKEHFNYVLASLIMGLVVWFTTSFEFKNWINIILSVLTGGIFYMGFLYLKKDKLVREICEIKLRKR